ncbi:MAG: methyltransferase domain-containing protein [Candidatus Heimdallarchaeota archaeon]|nr:methyltransferase domain-containing protein [Candidatus Heimdallarchaeota archaeon]
MAIVNEIEYLSEHKIFSKLILEQPIITNPYQLSIWSAYFWRRREAHQARPDPELNHVSVSTGDRILEVGSAYGRFTRKLVEKFGEKCEIHGLELNDTFEKYIHMFTRDHPELSVVHFTFGSILDAKSVYSEVKFDCIIIPMHTFPSFASENLPKLLANIRSILSPGGICVFSTRKFRKIDPSSFTDSFDGFFDLEMKENALSTIVYSFPSTVTVYGSQTISYQLYLEFDENYDVIQKYLVRSSSDYIHQDILEKVIVENKFEIESVIEEEFSIVYRIKYIHTEVQSTQ